MGIYFLWDLWDSPWCSHWSEDLSEREDVALDHLEGDYLETGSSTLAKDRQMLGRLDKEKTGAGL